MVLQLRGEGNQSGRVNYAFRVSVYPFAGNYKSISITYQNFLNNYEQCLEPTGGKHLTELWSVLYSSPGNACKNLEPGVILIKCKLAKYLFRLEGMIEVSVVILSCCAVSQERPKALYRVCNINNFVCLCVRDRTSGITGIYLQPKP